MGGIIAKEAVCEKDGESVSGFFDPGTAGVDRFARGHGRQLAYLQGELSEFTPLCQFDTLTVPVVDPDPPRLLCSQEINEPQISQISAD